MSPILTLLIQIVVVLGVARAFGAGMRWLGQPRVVGEMVAGLVLGPSVFGHFAPSAAAQVFPLQSVGTLEAFSHLGLVLYMLLVGVRMDAAHLRAKGGLVAGISVIGIVVPFVIGLAVAYPLVTRFGIPDASRTAFLLFVGLSLSMTAFPVLVRIVGEHGLDRTRLGTTAIAAASFNDVLAWAALALVTSLVGTQQATVAGTVGQLAAYGLVMAVAIGPLLRAQLRRTRSAEGRFVLVLLVALASAAATEAMGIHPLFGSFLVGVLLSGEAGMSAFLASWIEPLTVTLLLPLFFASTGLKINAALVPEGGLLVLMGLVILLAVAGKIIPPTLVARLGGFSWREAMGLGALMNTRGMVEIVLLVVGLDSGLLPPPLFTILALMAFVTTAMTAPLLTLLGFAGGVTPVDEAGY